MDKGYNLWGLMSLRVGGYIQPACAFRFCTSILLCPYPSWLFSVCCFQFSIPPLLLICIVRQTTCLVMFTYNIPPPTLPGRPFLLSWFLGLDTLFILFTNYPYYTYAFIFDLLFSIMCGISLQFSAQTRHDRNNFQRRLLRWLKSIAMEDMIWSR